MALRESFLSITQEQVHKTLLKCQARATIHLKYKPNEIIASSQDFEEMIDDISKLNNIIEDGKVVRKPNDVVLIDNSSQKVIELLSMKDFLKLESTTEPLWLGDLFVK